MGLHKGETFAAWRAQLFESWKYRQGDGSPGILAVHGQFCNLPPTVKTVTAIKRKTACRQTKNDLLHYRRKSTALFMYQVYRLLPYKYRQLSMPPRKYRQSTLDTARQCCGYRPKNTSLYFFSVPCLLCCVVVVLCSAFRIYKFYNMNEYVHIPLLFWEGDLGKGWWCHMKLYK